MIAIANENQLFSIFRKSSIFIIIKPFTSYTSEAFEINISNGYGLYYDKKEE